MEADFTKITLNSNWKVNIIFIKLREVNEALCISILFDNIVHES